MVGFWPKNGTVSGGRRTVRWTGPLLCLALGVMALPTSCATIPKEVVELSYTTGEDLTSLDASYDRLVHDFYEHLRAERRAYLDETWYPRFLNKWVEKGKLVPIAKGEVIFSEQANGLVPATPQTTPQESFLTLRDWVDYALYAYEKKEEELLGTLTEDETALRKDIADAFGRVIRANATVTAHLNNLREVQEVQDGLLEGLHLKDLRDRIDGALANASKLAAEGLNKIKTADAKVGDLTTQINPKPE